MSISDLKNRSVVFLWRSVVPNHRNVQIEQNRQPATLRQFRKDSETREQLANGDKFHSTGVKHCTPSSKLTAGRNETSR